MGWLNLRDFPDDLHDALRIAAAKRRTSIKALVVQVPGVARTGRGDPEEESKEGEGRLGNINGILGPAGTGARPEAMLQV